MKNKKNKLTTLLVFVLVAVVFAGVGAYAATTIGTQSDPLVTLSYLNERLYPQLVSQISDKADEMAAQIKSSMGTSGGVDSYAVVSLSKGQKLVGSVGCEVLLRIGNASVIAQDNPGLVDTTAGNALNAGSAVPKNHLCMVTIVGGGLQASDSVKVIVRGSYTIQ